MKKTALMYAGVLFVLFVGCAGGNQEYSPGGDTAENYEEVEDIPEDFFYEESHDIEETFPEGEDFPEEIPPEPLPIFTRQPIPEDIFDFISGVSFHENAHFDKSFLAYLTVTHVNFCGESVAGHLIVAAEIADEVLDIFKEIYEAGFPIHSIKLIDYFDASDYYSMAANNSGAFNFRYIAGTRTLSRHAFGMAIDINPIQNPYIRDNTVLPEAGRAYLDREDVRPGMITRGDAVYTAFVSRGWTWGGNWTRPIDYHHFERR